MILLGHCGIHAAAVLRLYDGAGTLLAERTYTDMGFSEVYADGWEEDT